MSKNLNDFTLIGEPLSLDEVKTGFHFSREKELEIRWWTVLKDYVDAASSKGISDQLAQSEEPKIPSN